MLGGYACCFFVGVCDDVDPADRLDWTLAASTGEQWFWIVWHVGGSHCEGGRARGKGRHVVKVESGSVAIESPLARPELIDDRRDDEPPVGEGRDVWVGWMPTGSWTGEGLEREA